MKTRIALSAKRAVRGLLVLAAAGPGLAAEDGGRVVSFNRDIRPLLASHCWQCHGPDAAARKAELRLDRRSDALGGNRIIAPGHPDRSELLTRLTSTDPDTRMPPVASTKQLTAGQIELFARWIAQGAPWEEHWSFVKPQRPKLPAVSARTWPSNGIDVFVLARLDGEGLQPAPPADRAALIRRVTLALTGLPPSIDEVSTFLADGSPRAYERVVDRLLDSPRYGEHMSWSWLDAARYADTSGYQADWERFMWPWRDWVVQAFNRNMPFDQFTVEQLAGDLLPNATRSQKLATGFNRNHRINDEGGSLDAEFEVEYVVDRVDTTATVWLGLTAGCARCHDHKYDPISQRDFYRLYAFFNNVPEKGIDGRHGAAVPYIKLPDRRVQQQLRRLKRQLAQASSASSEAASSQAGTVRAELQAAIKELEARSETPVMVMQELPSRRPTYLLKRGAYDQPDKQVALTSALPPALGRLPDEVPANRLSLAQWLVGEDNALTARVTINRMWQHHFGVGLVETSEDFGSRGARPSHPQLLDWLACEFVQSGWDVKAMHRLIVTSSTFQQSSHLPAELRERDPANRLLGRGPRQRLTGAAIRDQALFVSGLLHGTLGGAPVKPYQPAGLWKELSFASGKTTVDFYVQDQGADLYRRSLYTFWKRTVAPPRMAVFDGTGREMCRVRVELTNTPLQALTLQNDVTFVEAARHLAERMLHEGGQTAEQQLAYGWRLVLARRPEDDELRVLSQALERYRAVYRADRQAAAELLNNGESPARTRRGEASLAAFSVIAQTILNLDEAITRE